MAMPVQHNKLLEAVKVISEQGFAGMGEAMQLLMNEAMQIERSRYLHAEPYERTGERVDYANGFKPKTVKTTIGPLELRIPQTRQGEFYPSFMERGQRSEKALKIAIAEMYVQGVSTRNVTAILEQMCGCEVSSTDVSRASALLDAELSKWRERPLGQYRYLFIDARYEKVREGGCVIDCAVLVAYGVNAQGQRDILGTSVSLSEAEVHWRRFLESLVARGLHGLNLIVSDAHSGLKAALKAVFPSVPWQRCQFHLQQNAQAYITKSSRKGEVAESIRAIFNAENAAEAERLLKLTAVKYEKHMPKLSDWMLENIPQGLSVFQFPAKHRRRIRTSNIAERVNQEIRRRTRVARIFPNTASCERLVSAILMETSEQWVSGKIYLAV
jgi:putative transposase